MTACLNWTPEREEEVARLARTIGDHVRDDRNRKRLTLRQYARRYGMHRARLNEIECARKPNFTLLSATKLLDLAGYRLAIVPKEPA